MKMMKKIFVTTLLVLTFLSSGLFPVTNLNAERFSPWVIEKLVGKEAPGFTVNDLSGKNVSFSEFKGKPILLNFWATWCPYCREERPYLNSLYKEYRDRGLIIVAVSTDRSPSKVREYLNEIPMEFVVLHDNKNEAAGSYGVYSLPTSFLIDRDGIIRHKFMGLKDWTSSGSKKIIESLIKE